MKRVTIVTPGKCVVDGCLNTADDGLVFCEPHVLAYWKDAVEAAEEKLPWWRRLIDKLLD